MQAGQGVAAGLGREHVSDPCMDGDAHVQSHPCHVSAMFHLPSRDGPVPASARPMRVAR